MNCEICKHQTAEHYAVISQGLNVRKAAACPSCVAEIKRFLGRSGTVRLVTEREFHLTVTFDGNAHSLN